MHPSFRGKTIIILCVTLLALAAALYAVSQFTLRAQFSDLERQDALDDAQRAKNAISAEINALAVDVADWAAWDDLNTFASGRADEPLDVKMIDSTLRNLHLNLLIITSAQGRILLARSMDLSTQRGSDASPELLTSLRASGHLTDRDAAPLGSRGVVHSAQGLLLVAASPIRSTLGTGPTGGLLLMARILDDTFVQRIKDVTGLELSVFSVDPGYQPADDGRAVAERPSGADTWSRVSGSTTINSYMLLRTASGSPVGVVRVEQPRDIMRAASQTTSFFLLALLVSSTIIGGMGLFVTERLVFARVNRLVTDIAELAERAEPGSRLEGKERGSDLPGLTDAINNMLAALDESRDRLSEEREQLRHILETIGVGILLTDTGSGRVIEVNPVALSILGRSREEAYGAEGSSVLEPTAPADAARDEEEEIQNDEWLVHRADGSTVPVLLTVVPLKLGGRSCLLHSFVDISERKRAERRIQEEVEQRRQREAELVKLQDRLEAANTRLRDLSLLDGLTGIGNRRRFDQRLDQEWARAARDGHPLSLLMIDIDFFKAYNDAYGHVAGDRCLVAVASALARSVRRPADLVARYGGEEFVAILPDTAESGAIEVAERLRGDIASLGIDHAHSSIAPHLTISIGVATAQPTSDISPYSLVRTADAALYRAKEEGRDRVHCLPVGVARTRS